MEATKFYERYLKNLGFLLFAVMIIIWYIIVFIDCFSFYSQDTNQSLLSTHYNLLECSRIVHVCNRLTTYSLAILVKALHRGG